MGVSCVLSEIRSAIYCSLIIRCILDGGALTDAEKVINSTNIGPTESLNGGLLLTQFLEIWE